MPSMTINTDGKFLDGSVTHTNYEQGAWWQVDLGDQKNIKQIEVCFIRNTNLVVA
jgi:hypothetical protein